MGCEVAELADQELQQRAESAAAKHRGAASSSRNWWRLWIRDRIWIQNNTKTDIVVMVHRFKDISQLKAAAATAKVDVSGSFELGGTVDFALREGHAQLESIAAGDSATIDLGGGAEGAYVTAWVNGNNSKVYLIDKYVKPRCQITVTPGFIKPRHRTTMLSKLLHHSSHLLPWRQ